MSWTPRPRASIAISNATTQKWQDKTQNHAEPTKAPNAGRSGKIENSVISVGTCRQINTHVGWHCNGVGKPFAKRSQEKIYNPDAAKKHGSLVLGRGGFRISGQSPKLPMCRSSLHNYILHVCEETWSIHNNLQRIPMRHIRTVWVGLRFVCQNNNPFWPPEPAPKHDWFRNRETNCFVKTFMNFRFRSDHATVFGEVNKARWNLGQSQCIVTKTLDVRACGRSPYTVNAPWRKSGNWLADGWK